MKKKAKIRQEELIPCIEDLSVLFRDRNRLGKIMVDVQKHKRSELRIVNVRGAMHFADQKTADAFADAIRGVIKSTIITIGMQMQERLAADVGVAPVLPGEEGNDDAGDTVHCDCPDTGNHMGEPSDH